MRTDDGKWLALLVAVPFLLFAGVLLLGDGFYVRDVYRDYLPSRAILHQIVSHGEFPAWNRFLSAGQPLAANPGFQTFYPGTWLVFLVGFPLGFHLEIVLHLALAAAGMFLLLRSMECSRPTACFGAISFAFGGVILSLTNLLPFLTSVAWWPLVMLFARRTMRSGERRAAAAMALTLGMMLLAAEQSVLIQTAILLLSIAISERASLRSHWRPLLIAGILGLAIGAVQIVPALDLMRDASRGRGVSFDDATSWSMPSVRPLELFAPHAFGRITDDGAEYRGTWRYHPPRVPLIFSLYCGLLVPLLLMTGILTRTYLWKWTLALIAGSYLLAIGSNGPVVPLLFRVGLFRGIRYPEKFILLGLFAAVVFASLVFERLGEGRVQNRLMMLAALACAGAAASLVASAGIDSAIVLAVALAIAATVWVARRVPATMPLVLVLIAAGDLGMHLRELAPTMPRRFFDPPPVVAALGEAGGPSRLFHAASWPVWGDRALAPRGGSAIYWNQRATLPPFTSAMYGLQSALDLDINLTNLQPTADFVQSFWEVSSRGVPFDALLPMANVSSVLIPVGDGVRIAHLASAPRYGFAGAMEQISSRENFVRKLASSRWKSGTAFVARTPFAPAPGVVRRVEEHANDATLDVDASGRSFLTISVTPHRYWRATIDGRAALLEAVNVGFQGLEVPPGHHRIRMTYRNPWLAVCGAISVAAIAIAAIGCASSGRKPLAPDAA